VSVYYLCI